MRRDKINREVFFTINLKGYGCMNTKVKLLPLAIIASLSMSLLAKTSDTTFDFLPKGSKVVNVEKGIIGEETITFVKYLSGDDQEIKEKIFNLNMEEIHKENIRLPIPSKIGASLQSLMSENEANTSALFIVRITLNNTQKFKFEKIPFTSSLSVTNGVYRENTEVSSSFSKQRKIYDKAYDKYLKSKAKSLKEISKIIFEQNEWKDSDYYIDNISEDSDLIIANITKNQIDTLLQKSGEYILSIDLQHEVIDATANAMLDSRVDPYAQVFGNTNGSGIGLYMSESGCPDLGHITDYQRLSGLRTDHSEIMSNIIRTVSPQSYVYCRSGGSIPSNADLNGYYGNPSIDLVNLSSTDSDGLQDYNNLDRVFDNFVYEKDILAVVAAGNESASGNTSNNVRSPGKGMNVLTVGNHDGSTNLPHWSSNSINPTTGTNKPDLTAPGTDISAAGFLSTGTSASTAHTSAFLADLLSRYTFLHGHAALQKSFMLAGTSGSHDFLAVGPNTSNRGAGRIDFYNSLYNGNHTWWDGNKYSFSFFDSNDSQPNNGYIDHTISLYSNYKEVRVAFSWLNDGDYTLGHKSFAHDLGQDFDITVIDPQGNIVATSASRKNSFEYVVFNPTISGNYNIRISRASMSDTNALLKAGLSIGWRYY